MLSNVIIVDSHQRKGYFSSRETQEANEMLSKAKMMKS